MRFSLDQVAEDYKPVAGLGHIIDFFSLYANSNRDAYHPRDVYAPSSTIDKWLANRTASFVLRAEKAYESCDISRIVSEFESVIDDVSKWYIKANRRRFWNTGSSQDSQDAFDSVFGFLKATLTVVAPIVPFQAEQHWQKVIRPFDPSAAHSVHLENWPTCQPSSDSDDLEREVTFIRSIISAVLHMRNEAGVKVRQTLAELILEFPSIEEAQIRRHREHLCQLLNVKRVTLGSGSIPHFVTQFSLDRAKSGPILREKTSLVSKLLANLTVPETTALIDAVQASDSVRIGEYDLPTALLETQGVPMPGMVMKKVLNSKGTITLDTRLSPELRIEGAARDILRHIQECRKQSGLAISDRILIGISSTGEIPLSAITSFREIIETDSLGQIIGETVANVDGSAQFTAGDSPVTISIKKVVN